MRTQRPVKNGGDKFIVSEKAISPNLNFVLAEELPLYCLLVISSDWSHGVLHS